MDSPTAGFAAIAAPGARVLILGTLPSRMSLRVNQYYGHPQNAFWAIMGELFGAGRDLPYAERVRIVTASGVAVWDVLASAVRPGSMDSAIDRTASVANDFSRFYREQPDISMVCFNGQAAAKLYRQLVAPGLENGSNTRQYQTMPSTSPAYASMSFAEKLERWRVVRSAANNNKGE